MYAACPTNFTGLDLITLTALRYVISFIILSLPPPILGPNVPLSALFSNTLNLFYSHSVRDGVSHPYKALLDTKQEDKGSRIELYEASREFNLLSMSKRM